LSGKDSEYGGEYKFEEEQLGDFLKSRDKDLPDSLPFFVLFLSMAAKRKKIKRRIKRL